MGYEARREVEGGRTLSEARSDLGGVFVVSTSADLAGALVRTESGSSFQILDATLGLTEEGYIGL